MTTSLVVTDRTLLFAFKLNIHGRENANYLSILNIIVDKKKTLLIDNNTTNSENNYFF